MKSEAEIEQEARILYEIVHDGLDALEYFELPLAWINGWKKLAKLVLIDSEAKQKENSNRYFNPSRKYPTDTQSIPASLRSELFYEAWGNWLSDRKERNKKVTARAAAIQLKKLEAMGVKRAIAAIENSIEKGYQGIFEPKSGDERKAYEPPVDF